MTQTTIFLVLQLWTDSLENSYNQALGYEIIGYVASKDEFVLSQEYVEGTGWPIEKGKKEPLYKFKEVKHV